MILILQLFIAGVWGIMLTVHTRRLMRLARVEVRVPDWRTRLRSGLHRMWWWLGREEFWRAVQRDGAYALNLTVLVLIFAIGCAL